MRRKVLGKVFSFLFTDVQDSTPMWDKEPQAMRRAMTRYEQIISEVVKSHGGMIVRERGEGDSHFAVFLRASDAVTCAYALQRAVRDERWPTHLPFRVRAAVHTGESEIRQDDYHGAHVNRAARLRSLATGGQTLLSQATVNLLTRFALPEGLTYQYLGTYHLRGLQEPERVYQLVWEGSGTFPSLGLGLLHNLPHQRTSFIGRQIEVDQISASVRATPLVSLVGPGGVGKTRLAVQVASTLIAEFPDGVWMVELQSITQNDRNTVIQELAHTLQIMDHSGTGTESLLRAVTKVLNTKRLLVLLDNCEHVSKVVREVVVTLSEHCPGLRILATSRHPLGVPGEHIQAIKPFKVSEIAGHESLESVLSYEAIQLFIDRARAIGADFSLSPQNVRDVGYICYHLDGIPLAIELAAAQLSAFSLKELAASLDERFVLLYEEGRPLRHQTLRHVVDWSYHLLAEREQTLFRRLAVMNGSFSLDAVFGICTTEGDTRASMMTSLRELVRASMVVKSEWRDESRYQLLETIRQYAAERLREAEEWLALRSRHQQWALEVAEAIGLALERQTDALALERLDLDYDNLRSALEWRPVPSDSSHIRLRLAVALGTYWDIRGRLTEGRLWLTAGLSDPSESIPSDLLPTALYLVGRLACAQCDWDAAITYLDDARRLAHAVGDRATEGICLGVLGRIMLSRIDLEKAEEFGHEGVVIGTDLHDRRILCEAYNTLGTAARHAGELTRARGILLEALHLGQSEGDKRTLIRTFANLSGLFASMEEYALAESYASQGLALCKEIGFQTGRQTMLANLGIALVHQGREVEAEGYFREVIELSDRLDRVWGMTTGLFFLGMIAARLGDHPGAIDLMVQSLQLHERLQNKKDVARNLEYLAISVEALGATASAVTLLSAAACIRAEAHVPLSPTDARMIQGAIIALRNSLSEEVFNEHWGIGAGMAVKDAIRFAREHASVLATLVQQ